jgi:hypothetical protein
LRAKVKPLSPGSIQSSKITSGKISSSSRCAVSASMAHTG